MELACSWQSDVYLRERLLALRASLVRLTWLLGACSLLCQLTESAWCARGIYTHGEQSSSGERISARHLGCWAAAVLRIDFPGLSLRAGSRPQTRGRVHVARGSAVTLVSLFGGFRTDVPLSSTCAHSCSDGRRAELPASESLVRPSGRTAPSASRRHRHGHAHHALHCL